MKNTAVRLMVITVLVLTSLTVSPSARTLPVKAASTLDPCSFAGPLAIPCEAGKDLVSPSKPDNNPPNSGGSSSSGSSGLCSALPNGVLSALCNGVTSGPGAILGWGLDAFFQGLTQDMINWALSLLQYIADQINSSTTPNVGAPYLVNHYGMVWGLGLYIAVMMLFWVAAQALFRIQPSMSIVRLARGCMGVAAAMAGLPIIQAVVLAGEDVTAWVAPNLTSETGGFLADMSNVMQMSGLGPVLGVLVGTLVLAMAEFVIWIELLMRNIAILVLAVVLPFACVMVISDWGVKLARQVMSYLLAAILAKPIIVLVISIGASMISYNKTTGLSLLVSGFAVCLAAILAPIPLLKLFMVQMEAGLSHAQAAGRTVANATRRVSSYQPGGGSTFALERMASRHWATEGAGGAGGAMRFSGNVQFSSASGASSVIPVAGVVMAGAAIGKSAAQAPGRAVQKIQSAQSSATPAGQPPRLPASHSQSPDGVVAKGSVGFSAPHLQSHPATSIPSTATSSGSRAAASHTEPPPPPAVPPRFTISRLPTLGGTENPTTGDM